VSGTAPTTALALRLSFEHTAGPLRLGVGLAGATRQASAGEGTARFSQGSLEPAVCWVKQSGWLRPGLCGALRVGVLHAAASNVPDATSASALILAPLANARAEIPLGTRLLLGGSLGVSVPLSRPTFTLVGPERQIFAVPGVTAEGGVFLGTHFL
jgi:hypothetical protein